MKLVRIIDLERCIGCRSCVAACMNENFYIRGNPWNFLVEYEIGKYPNVRRVFVPMNCMHCENPPCKNVCDEIGVHAISKNGFGVVLIDYEKCIGCRYCEAVCPYGVPHYIKKVESIFPEGPTPYDEISLDNRHPTHRKRPNVAEKCTFCWHRIEKAVEDGKVSEIGKVQQYTPACDVVCPVKARYFGDIDDPESEVSRIIAERGATQLKKEFGTRPQVYYVLEGGDY
jgi:Fe-S-cluster-containing dehydrogenase component